MLVKPPANQKSVLRKGAFTFLAIWAFCAAYSIWSYHTVYPIKGNPLKGGRAVIYMPILPVDTYEISFLIRIGSIPPRHMLATFADVKRLNSRRPIAFTADVKGLLGTVKTYHGTTRGWIVGNRPNLSPSQNFNEYLQLYKYHPANVEFFGFPLNVYRLELSVTDMGDVATKYPVSVFVAGARDDGYYPVGPILLLAFSAILFVAVMVIALVVKIIVSLARRI